MSDLFDEINEDLKHERYSQLWQHYGNYLLLFILAIILSSIGYTWYNSHETNVIRKYGSALFTANKYYADSNNEEALKLYDDIVKKGGNSEGSIALLNKAMLLASSGKKDQAKAQLLILASNSSYPKEFRELSELIYINYLIDESNKNDKTDKEILQRLGQISSGSSVWRYSANELLGFYDFSLNKIEDSKKIFQQLKDDTLVPSSIRNRSIEMLELIQNKEPTK